MFGVDIDRLLGTPLSLTHGWLPITVQAVTAVMLLLAVGWRTSRWRLVWLPIAVVVGVTLATMTHWYVRDEGLSGTVAPWVLWVWVGLVGFSVMVLLLGWPSAGWFRRVASFLATVLCVVSAGLTVNVWVGYFPTLQTAWHQITAGPLPDQTDIATITKMQLAGEVPSKGVLVSATIPADASGFKHREEFVYLPPAWFATNPPPALPAIMMIGAEFQNPSDWIRVGSAIRTIDNFAAQHNGNAPVLVFVDATGSFDNDTECVNGPRGNAADHLVKDVVPFVNLKFGTSPLPANWGIVGFSMGGTCAINLTVMHPDLFSSVVDIAGDLAPNAGNKEQTIERLFGGDAVAYDAFNPSAVMTRHGKYDGVSAWFPNPAGETGPAKELCDLGRMNGIDCAVAELPGKHDWQFAANAFAEALPWLAGQIGTPEVPRIPLPRTG